MATSIITVKAKGECLMRAYEQVDEPSNEEYLTLLQGQVFVISEKSTFFDDGVMVKRT
jgi:hypothetical protein